MWILECEGDVLSHKKIWLRPGKTYLFGRTKPEKGRYRTGFQINHKTVSRKHLILSVASVEPDNVGVLSHRSEITFEDAGTKLGTTIDDQKIKAGGKITSSKGTHVFKPSGYDYAFTVTWKPVVFSYTFSSKEYKNGKDPLMPIRLRLAELDVKAIPNYASGKTTHVIASKRNTARGLQALVEGNRIVTDEFVSALEVAATATDLNETESFAALEQDFEHGWPNETDFLPPAGKEPGPKEAEHYAPAPERKELFKGFTFVFFDTRQFESLQPPITLGGGKATTCSFEENVTTVAEAHKFVKAAAGESDGGELSGDNKVVCVKFGSQKSTEEWADKFKTDLALALGFRLIEQNEFLEAILVKDPGKLFRRLRYRDDESAGPVSRRSNSADADSSRQQSAALETMKPLPRRAIRGKVKSLFKGFDDGFDENASALAPPSHLSAGQTQANDARLGTGMEIDGNATASQRNGHTRPVPDSDGDSELEQMEANMLKGTRAMKRRLETKDFAADPETSEATTRATSELVATDEPPKKKIKKETDLNAAVRAHREAEEAKHKQDSDEEGNVSVDDLTLDQMKILAVVEEFTPKAPSHKQHHRDTDRPGWNPEWNGRKNFKKFRRQGEGTSIRRGQSVIVPLEQVKPKEASISQAYWTSSATKSRAGRVRESRDSSSDEEGFVMTRGSGTSRSQRSKPFRVDDLSEEEAVNEAADENNEIQDDAASTTVPSNLQTGQTGEGEQIIDVDAPRTIRAHGPATQTTTTQVSAAAGRKRAATQSKNGKSTAPKRQRRLDEGMRRKKFDDPSDSDDDLKFQFKKKR